MMPRYDNLFTSHMPVGDPRSPLTAAGGCVWPTVPAWRYLCVSNNATGIWGFLNYQGILITHMMFFPGHDYAGYFGGGGGTPITWIVAAKRYVRPEDFYTWEFQIQHAECSSQVSFEVVRPYETCNRMIPLGNHFCQDEPGSETGSSFRMLQVVFDQTEPPGGWPPT